MRDGSSVVRQMLYPEDTRDRRKILIKSHRGNHVTANTTLSNY